MKNVGSSPRRGGGLGRVTGHQEYLADIYEDDLGRRITMTLARLYEEALSDDAKAIAKYNRALDFGGDESEPLAALDRLLEISPDSQTGPTTSAGETGALAAGWRTGTISWWAS